MWRGVILAAALLVGGCASSERAERPRAWFDASQGRPVDVVLPGRSVCRHRPEPVRLAGAVRPVHWVCGPTSGRVILGEPELVDTDVVLELGTVRRGRLVRTRTVAVPLRALQLADGTTCRRAGPGHGATTRFRCRDGRVVLGSPTPLGDDEVRVDVARVEDGRVLPLGPTPVLRVGAPLPG